MIPQLLIVSVTLLALAALAARTLLERDRRRAQARRENAMHERLSAEPTVALAAAVEQLAAAAGALEQAARDRGSSRVGHRVTVHTTNDHTLFGVVVGDYTDRLSLEDAEYVVPGGNKPLPGRQDVATDDIAWIDVHAHVAAPSVLTEA